MKNLLLTLLVSAIGILLGCSKNEMARYESFEKLKSSLKSNERISWSVAVPVGTTVSKDHNKVKITIPKEVKLMVLASKNNHFEELLSADYTCTCGTKDGTCKPFVAGDIVGCSTDKNKSCTQCIGKKTNVSDQIPKHSVIYYVHEISPSNMGVLDGFAAIQTITDLNLLLTLPPITQDLLNNSRIDSVLNKIISGYQYPSNIDFHENKIPEGFSLVPIGIENHLAYIIIPKNEVEPGMIEIAPIMEDPEGEISCKGCDGRCKLKSAKLGQIKYCDGCDSGCTIRGYLP